MTQAAGSHAGGARNDSIAGQIALLGDTSYAIRERATRNLIDAGIAARPLLERLRSSSDPEVRMRAAKVLRIVVETDFRVRLRAFAADVDGRKAVTLPAWDRFRNEFGATREARALFVSMQRGEATLLEALAAKDPGVGALFAERCQDLQSSILTQENPFGVSHSETEEANTGSIAALLFVGACPEVVVEEQQALWMEGFLAYPQFREALHAGATSPITGLFRQLVSDWLIKAGVLSPYRSLLLACELDLKEAGLAVGRKLLEAGIGPLEARPYALLAVGRFGTREDLPLVEACFADERVCTFRRGARELRNQVRDVALGVAAHLSAQDVSSYGFLRPEPNTQLLFVASSLRFKDDDARQKAFQQWADWKAGQAAAPGAAEKK